MISLADLHCDTLYRCYTEHTDLNDKRLHINLSNAAGFDRLTQTFAHYLPEMQENKWEFLNNMLSNSKSLLLRANILIFQTCDDLKNNRCAVLSVEGGDLFDDVYQAEQRVLKLKEQGIVLFSMIYNHTNRLGCGALSADDTGLTLLGRQVLQLLENSNIILDVSHASYRSTDEILSLSKTPVCATHSNAYTLMPHPRNLRDEHLRKIAQKGGVIGINLYPAFLAKSAADRNDIYRHIAYICDKCGEDAIAFGCDFDGVDMLPRGIKNISSMEQLYFEMRRLGYSERLLDKLFYNNYCEFLKANIRR